MNANADLPAFGGTYEKYVPDQGQTISVRASGLTKRELFAAMAMQGLLSNLGAIRREGFRDEEIELFAVMRADALLAALSRVGGEP